MPTATLKCAQCKERFPRERMEKVNNISYICGLDCKVAYATKKGKAAVRTKERKEHIINKKKIKSRMKWFSELQVLVNQFVVHVRDKLKPCCTCGKLETGVKYDAGHRHHAGRGGGDRRRFMLTNIHKQCSVNCNQYGGGMPAEYDRFLDNEYGAGAADKLKCENDYPTLKEIFPTWQDIEFEMIRYRILLRENGVRPQR